MIRICMLFKESKDRFETDTFQRELMTAVNDPRHVCVGLLQLTTETANQARRVWYGRITG
jgi:hypothetical protein